jgi:hypothetical protein
MSNSSADRSGTLFAVHTMQYCTLYTVRNKAIHRKYLLYILILRQVVRKTDAKFFTLSCVMNRSEIAAIQIKEWKTTYIRVNNSDSYSN